MGIQIKKNYLYIINGLYIILAVWIFILASKYVFINNISSFGTAVIALAVIGGGSTFLYDENKIQTIFKRMIIIYILGLFVFTIGFHSSLPTYTYGAAVSKIEEETGEKMLETKEAKISIGQYIIYTNTGTYIFNAESGKYWKRTK